MSRPLGFPQPWLGAERVGRARTEPHRSLWIEEAFADPSLGEGFSPNLQGEAQADVAIVGGGYTGLWTALHLKRLDPSCDVILLEAGVCGGEASGRNGGLALSWWAKLETLFESVGTEDAERLARSSERAIDELGRFQEASGLDFHFRRGGWIWTATSAAQLGAWSGARAAGQRVGSDAFEELSAKEIQARLGSPVHLGGILERRAATVQPARLSRALRKAALEAGVRIHENSPVKGVPTDGRLTTPSGRVQAACVLFATNVWLARHPRLRRAILPLGSDVISTEPIPDLLESHGWIGGESFSNSRLMVHYSQTTRDGRIVFGRGGGSIGPAGRILGSFDGTPRRSEEIAREMVALIPFTKDVKITHQWGGAVDRSSDGLPFFGRLRGEVPSFYAAGFSGNGVAPTWVAGRELAQLALGRQGESELEGLHNGIRGRFPPEPARTLGGILVRDAVQRKETLEDRGGRPGWLVAKLAKLAPSGFFKISKED